MTKTAESGISLLFYRILFNLGSYCGWLDFVEYRKTLSELLP